MLRAQMREKKQAMTMQQIEKTSFLLAEQLFAHPAYRNASSVFGYLSYNQEVRTLPILRRAQLDAKRVAVPKIFGKQMRFIWLDDLCAVRSGSYGIAEPIADEPIADDETALVLVPGLAFDAQGHRCGYGGGFYDRFLAEHPTHPALALCYGFQMLAHIKTEAHDICVDHVLFQEVTD